MLDTKEILRRLKGLKGRYPQICRETGINYSYLTKLAAGLFENPGSKQIDLLRKNKLIKNYKDPVKS
jgi:hypothetical protein